MTQNTDPRALTFGPPAAQRREQLTKYWNWGERHRITPDPLDPMEGTSRLVQVQAAHDRRSLSALVVLRQRTATRTCTSI
jgi:hypothetical protein